MCVCMYRDDNHCKASQICRCLHTFAHKRLTLSTAALRWRRSFKTNSRVNLNTGLPGMMSVKLRYISSAGGVFPGWHNTLVCRCLRLMYNKRPTVKTAGVLQPATFTPKYVRKGGCIVRHFKYVTQQANSFESEEE